MNKLLPFAFLSLLILEGCATTKSTFSKGSRKITKDTVVVTTESHQYTIVRSNINKHYTIARDTIKRVGEPVIRRFQSRNKAYVIEVASVDGREIRRDTVGSMIADADLDGVPDFEDECPKRKGPYSNKGCPESVQVNITKVAVISTKKTDSLQTNTTKTDSVQTEVTKVRVASAKQELAKHAHDLEYHYARTEIRGFAHPRLDSITKVMEKYSQQKFVIEGHTDNLGYPEKNKKLGLKRAESARDYFVGKGILLERLKVKSKGQTEPIATNATAAGRSKNRRINVLLDKK